MNGIGLLVQILLSHNIHGQRLAEWIHFLLNGGGLPV